MVKKAKGKRLKWYTFFKRDLTIAFVACCAINMYVAHAYGEEGRFTLAVVPDAQLETGDARMEDRLHWLVDNRSELNLKMVLFCGDLMNFNLDSQYRHQSDALKVLDVAALPFAMALGNHDTAAVREDSGSAAPGDVNANLRNTERFNSYYPLSRFINLQGLYEQGKIDNSCHAFKAGGLDWMVVCLELWARTEVVEWARKVVESHPHHNFIFLTHAHLRGDGSIQQNNGGYGDNSPQFVFDRVMKPYANVRLVFCGHTGKHGLRTDQGAHGNTIYQFLQCYHDNASNPVRLVEIDSLKGTITTRVFCPSAGKDKDDGSARTITGCEWVRPE